MSSRYHPPLHADVALARRIEAAEMEFCVAAARHEATPALLDAGAGRALFSRPGSFLNKTLGLGVGTPVAEGDIEAIVEFYGERGEDARVEVCPLADAELVPRLAARGFVLREFENELARPLPLSTGERATLEAFAVRDLLVAPAAAQQDDAWLRVVTEGFEIEHAVMRAFLHPAITRYLVAVEGRYAGGGAAFVEGQVLGIFGTATIPAFRRRGVQTALVARALLDAGPDVDLAIATTAPGSSSQRTFERLGFQVVYTRAILVLPLQNRGHGPLRST